MSNYVILCQLDKKTQLVASAHAFVIKKLVKNKVKEGEETKIVDAWVSRYFYADISDAVKGYVKHTLRNPPVELDGDVRSLVETIEHLEKTIEHVATDFQKAWNDRMQDPIEAHLLRSGADDE